MRNHLILGDWNVLCDSCGRKFKASQVQRRWDGLLVCKEDYELRHPQDFLRVQKERISVPFVRPYPAQDTYLSTAVLEIEFTNPLQEDFIAMETGEPLNLET